MVKRVLSFRAAKTERDYRVRFTTALSEQIDPRITSSALKKYTTNQKGDIVTKAIIDFRISLFRKMPILRRVIIEDPTSMFPLVDGSLNFLSHSLKRLRIASQTYPDRGITATKACWLLTFCPMLLQTVLGFTISFFFSSAAGTLTGAAPVQAFTDSVCPTSDDFHQLWSYFSYSGGSDAVVFLGRTASDESKDNHFISVSNSGHGQVQLFSKGEAPEGAIDYFFKVKRFSV